MNVLADYVGHSDLYYSLYALFEKRLGMNLYRPTEEEGWTEKGIHTTAIPDVEGMPELIDGVYYIPTKMNYVQRAITFNTFLDMNFDIIVTTTRSNEEPFCNMIKSHQLNVKFVRQIGNIHETPICCKNVLLAMRTPMPENINYINYYPEHYEEYFYTVPSNHNTIKNFANNLPSYINELKLWEDIKNTLKNFTFEMHGEGGVDGAVPHLAMPTVMKESAFIWHIKPHGGGGFIPRQALACGRPCIVKKKYCNIHHELADNLFKDGINCIDFDLRTFDENVRLIREWSEPDAHIERCEIVAETFKKDVNFVAEAEKIKVWIDTIKI